MVIRPVAAWAALVTFALPAVAFAQDAAPQAPSQSSAAAPCDPALASAVDACPQGSLPATPPPPPPSTSPIQQTREESYGQYVAISDAASAAVVIVGAASLNGYIAAAGVGGYLVGAPVVHFAHGEGGRGAASLGLRTVVPLLAASIGGLVGLVAGSGTRDWAYGGLIGLGVGFAAGLIGTSAFDIFVLAKHRVPVEGATGARKQPGAFQVAPQVAADPRGFSLGAVGTF